MPKVFLHIGFDKTGTTALQRYFSNNAGLLGKKLTLPVFDDGRVEFSHHLIADLFDKDFTEKPRSKSIFNGLSARDADKLREVYFDKLREQIANSQKPVLISSESFVKSSVELDRVAAFFSEFNLKVVAYLRRQDNYIKSKYSQHLKSKAVNKGLEIRPFDEFSKGVGRCRYDKFFDKWVDAGVRRKKILAFTFERERMPDGIIPLFFQDLGINYAKLPEAKGDVNKGLSDFEMMALERLMTSSEINESEKDKLIEAAIRKSGTYDGPKDVYLLSGRHRLEILERFERSNERLAIRYFEPESAVFHEPLPKPDDPKFQPSRAVTEQEIENYKNWLTLD